MSKALVIIKSMGIGDLCILISNIHAISKKISKPVTVLSQKNTRAYEIFKHDPHVEEVIEFNEREIKGFFNIIKKIKLKKFDQSYIYSDSIRLFLVSKLSGIGKNYQYKFFSKKNKNFFKTAKEFTEKALNEKINSQSNIFFNQQEVNLSKQKFNISSKAKNIVCGISASGPTKRWDIKNYIKLFEKINSQYECKFFLAGGPADHSLIKEVINSSIGNKCISFANMTIAEAIPIIRSCEFYIGNDTGWGHICSGLNLKSLFLFMDSPPAAYGLYSQNISIIVPEGETIESCGHNTKGQNKILFTKVLNKFLEIIN